MPAGFSPLDTMLFVLEDATMVKCIPHSMHSSALLHDRVGKG